MSLTLGSQFTQRLVEWNEWKTLLNSRGSSHQSHLQDGMYTIWFYDGLEVFLCNLWNGPIPDTRLALGFTQEDADIDFNDFQTSYLPASNQKINNAQKDKANTVAVVGREGSETIWATHNFCDRTTWFGDSVRITEEIATDSGDHKTFTLAHPNIIDMSHGKIFDEDAICEDVPHGYSIVVKVDGVLKELKEAFTEEDLSAPGDYYINYTEGKIIFSEETLGTVLCSYSYENGSTWVLKPLEGKALDIEEAEVQFSQDFIMNDSIVFAVYGYVDVFAPQYLQSNGGPFPSGYKIKLEETNYKTISQMVDEALGSYPVVPAIGGSSRGLTSPIYGFPFAYAAVRRLHSRYGLELRVSLKHNKKYGGQRSTGTFYCVSRNISEIK